MAIDEASAFPKAHDPGATVVMLLDTTQILQIYNADRSIAAVEINDDILAWVAKKSEECGWVSSEFVGYTCILKAGATLSTSKKSSTQQASVRAASGCNTPMVIR